ncbi:glycosyltransferase [Phytohabitans rumicis]|uniref:Dolichol monophosphate mannose synthase n=1 Tax=Phytohabitans rumicis TaxID=1076125 RepID=A0A6V8LQY6_9ACTN|nr:glycosyltransferase [Phytohabitans rumicis]GFJ96706.1 dolichol monophosphate mannose synthase [Phytohabitans rumicis]
MSDLYATIVVPCRHEEGNVGPLLDRIKTAMNGHPYEVLFVDDSDNDATVQAIRAADPNALVFHRMGEQRWGGLAGAVIDGLRMAHSDRVVVMDADLQHPPEVVPALLSTLDGGAELVMASRYTDGGDPGGLSGPFRRLVSGASTWLAKATFPIRLRGVTDPMTGFFGLRRSAVDAGTLHSRGFKILLEILARYPRLRRAEVPLRFDKRLSGDSKGDARQGLEYLKQLPRLRVATTPLRYFATARFRDFAIGGAVVAAAGVVLLEALVRTGMDPLAAFGVQLAVTLALNFSYNYLVTWRDRVRAGLARRISWFLATRGATQFLSWLLFAGLSAAVGLHHQVANGVCLVMAAAVNYYVTDKVVFTAGAASARGRRVARWLVAGAAALGIGAALYAAHLPAPTVLAASLLAVALFNTAIGALEVRWRLYGWRTRRRSSGCAGRRPTARRGSGSR